MNFLCTLLSITCTAGTISGSAYVHDGDTIYIRDQPIRLFGVDAEELDEPNGYAARAHLRELVAGQVVTCHRQGWSHDRWVATCFANGQDIGAAMIRAGYALDCFHYSGGQYRPLEPMGARSRLIQKPYC